MRSVAVCLLAALSPVIAPATCAAEDRIDPAALSLAKSFAQICVLAVPDFQNVMVRARIEGWKQVEGPPHDKLVVPKGEGSRSSWVTKGVDDFPVGITISRQPRKDVHMMETTCAVQNPNVAPAGTANALAAVLPLPEPKKTVEGDKTIIVWSFMWGNRTLTVAAVARTSGEPGVILNAVIQQNV